MKKMNFRKVCLGTFLLLFSMGLFAQTTISGKISDADTGEGLIGANVIISGTSIGTTTDFDGNYTLTSDQSLPWKIEVSYTGYSDQNLDITSAGTQNITMASGVNFNQEVVISASRKKEKAVDAPASISVLSAEKMSVVADGGNIVNSLKNTVGVSVVDQGIDRSSIALRGAAIVNQGRVQVFRDYRPMTQIADLNFESQLTPVSNIDVKQVEVLRGPAGALYGPSVNAGVVHFLTMDPWDKCGTTVSVTGGEQNLRKFDLRHAGVISDKFGYKILLGGMGADDFQIEESLAAQVAAGNNGGGWGGKPGMTGGGLLEGATLTHGGNMIKEVGNRYGTAALYFKPADNVSITGTFDYGSYKGNRRNVQGDFYNKQTVNNYQIRAQLGDLFVAANRLVNLGSTDEADLDKNPSWNANYANGTIAPNGKVVESKYEIQYPFTAGPLDLTVGGDYINYTPEDNFRQAGRNANQSYVIFGGYLQAKYNIAPNLVLNAVARYDKFDAFDKTALSPRAALIYKPNSSSQVRVSYNRSFSSMVPVRTFLDFKGPQLPFNAQLQFVGGAAGFTYNNPIVAGMPFAQGLNGTSLAGDVIPLGGFFGPGPLAGALMGALGADGFAALQAAAASQTTGATYTTFRDNIPVGTLAGYGTSPAQLPSTNTFEIGYKGTVGDNLAVQIDIYNNRIEDFESNATPITPFIQAPGLAADLGAIAASAGLDGAAVTAAVNGTPYGNGGNIGWAESDWSQSRPGGEGLPQINFGFLNFGEASYWGYDLGLEYYINPEFSFFGNYSGINKNQFSLEDLGERADSGFPAQYLNTPKSRIRMGINYLKDSGLFGSLAFSNNSEYEAVVGIFRGTVEARNLVDLTVGYKMDNGLKATLGISNLLNNKYSYFPRLPQITRVATLNLQYHFGGNGCDASPSISAPKMTKADTDGDGIKDAKDLCPNIAGTRKFKGCPKSKAEMDAEAAAAEAARIKAEEAARVKAEMEAKARAEEAARLAAEKAAQEEAARVAAEKAAAEAAEKKKMEEAAAAKAAADAAAKRTAEIKAETSRVFNAALTGIQFNSSRASLKSTSYADLNNVVQVMRQYPEITVTIEGHTDAQGNDASNMTLSQNRATEVLNYLVSKGIAASRLRAVGYGETRPVADNNTATGRAQNRRVAFVVN